VTDESFNKIDYRIRPAKSVERKLIGQTLGRLSRIAPLDEWAYVGFGSVYFADFILFHKTLGISDMTSIEQAKAYRDRVLFNKPYGYVGMAWGRAAKCLPDVDWRKRTIVWLDYDRPLSGEVLADLAMVSTNARGGSVLLATVDTEAKRMTDQWLADLREELGPDVVPSSLTASHLKGSKGPSFAWRLINRAIREAVRIRNLTTAADLAVEYRQLFNFVYDDGSRMVTAGGILVGKDEQEPLKLSGIQDQWFVRGDSVPLELKVPKLTFKEMRGLDRCLPLNPHSEAPPPALPPGAMEQYALIYRYFPAFVEADF
jgi:hypothetical protein